MRENYRYLLEDFCNLCGIKGAGRIMEGGSIEFNGIAFSLIYSETVNPDIMFIYCDFGDVPLGRQADAYKALLEMNLFFCTGTGPTFSVSDETGRVLLVDQYPLVQKSAPEELRNVLVDLASLAKDWRIDHFLEKPASSLKSLSDRNKWFR